MRSEGHMSPDPAQNSCDLDQMSHDVQTTFEKVGCEGNNTLVKLHYLKKLFHKYICSIVCTLVKHY